MWDYFRSKCSRPFAPEEKEWLERCFAWLSDQFGLDRLRDAPVVLPSPRFFPDPFRGRPEDITSLFGRVCGHLGLDPSRFESALFSGRIAPGSRTRAAGQPAARRASTKGASAR